jgi:hypothetical protein
MRKAPKVPKYVRKLKYLQRVGLLPAGVHSVDVLHDDFCRHWKGKPCNCDCQVRLKWTQPIISEN